MDFVAKISIKGEERGIKIYRCTDEKKGKEKKLEESKDGIGMKEYEVHTNCREEKDIVKIRNGINKIGGNIKGRREKGIGEWKGKGS